MLGKGCVLGGALDKQYKAIKASQTISSILHSGPYGICRIRKPVNKERAKRPQKGRFTPRAKRP